MMKSLNRIIIHNNNVFIILYSEPRINQMVSSLWLISVSRSSYLTVERWREMLYYVYNPGGEGNESTISSRDVEQIQKLFNIIYFLFLIVVIIKFCWRFVVSLECSCVPHCPTNSNLKTLEKKRKTKIAKHTICIRCALKNKKK